MRRSSTVGWVDEADAAGTIATTTAPGRKIGPGGLSSRLAAAAPTVIDAHYVYPDGVAAMLIADELDLPCVVTARGTDINVLAERPRVRRQVRSCLGGARALFAVSDALRDSFDAIVGGGRVKTARNGVDLSVFCPGDGRAARAWDRLRPEYSTLEAARGASDLLSIENEPEILRSSRILLEAGGEVLDALERATLDDATKKRIARGRS